MAVLDPATFDSLLQVISTQLDDYLSCESSLYLSSDASLLDIVARFAVARHHDQSAVTFAESTILSKSVCAIESNLDVLFSNDPPPALRVTPLIILYFAPDPTTAHSGTAEGN